MLNLAILHIGLAQSLFAAFVLLTKKRVAVSDRILVACLLTIALKFLILLLHQEHSEFFDLDFSIALIPLTFGPYLYLYTHYLVEGSNRFQPLHLLHFAPLVIVTLTYFVFFKDEVSFDEVSFLEHDDFLWIRTIYGLIFFSSILIYSVLTFTRLREFRRSLKSEFSFMSGRLKLYWLNFISVLFVTIFLVYLITGGINALTFSKQIDLGPLTHVGLTILAYSISYFGLRQPLLFRKTTPEEDPVVAPTPSNAKNKPKGKFSPERAAELINRLNKHMETERPYLNPELTLRDLSSQINLSKSDLTDLLNNHIGKNFFSYVNEFRLMAVIKKLESPDFAHLTILAIAYDCGFNSKSTFNSLFKQHTGITPSEYKKANS